VELKKPFLSCEAGGYRGPHFTDSRKANVFEFEETRSNIDHIMALILGLECEQEVEGIKC
jgi:hypothetical protein